MKAIQITMDERLLRKLDSDAEVKRDGRSAVIRRVLHDYLHRKRRQEIDEAYRRAYSKDGAPEFADWPEAGTWPEA